MALIIEDGTGVVEANSFASVADATAFFESRGFTAPAMGYEAALMQAADVLLSLSFSGAKSYAVNDLPFPRVGLLDASNVAYPATVVPAGVWRAQLWLTYYVSEGFSPNAAPAPVLKHEKVGSLEREFAVTDSESTRQTTIYDLPNAYAALAHMMRTTETRDTRRVVR